MNILDFILLCIDVETSCNGESLLIMASFNEPFYGLLYANGFPSSSSCRVEGTGNRLLRLVFNVSECGIRFISMEVCKYYSSSNK
jgi:hypothetical protein